MLFINKILRSFKKYYSKDFQKFVGKWRQTFTKIKQNSEKISKYAKDYLQQKFNENATNEMELLLYWFLDKQHATIESRDSNNFLKRELFSLLYTFNTRKMQEWLKRPGFARMMKDYLSTPNIVKNLAKLESDPELIRSFEKYTKRIWRICSENLNELHN